MRQYQPIWEQIKKNGRATLIAPITSHSKIIQAVRKEKWRDIGFRFLAREKNITYKLFNESDIDKCTVTFYLKEVTGIKLKDL